MIGRLSGIIVEKQPPHLLIEVQGVAYEVEASMNTFYQLPEVGQTIILHTHLIVREDAHLLFGFHELTERTLFRQLIKVNGVGPKLAVTILSSIGVQDFVDCIQNNDSMRLVKLPGVGKKTAERLIIEMRDRLKSWYENIDNDSKMTMTVEQIQAKIPEQEALSALITLGFKQLEAQKIISKIDTRNLTSEEIIRLALKAMINQ